MLCNDHSGLITLSLFKKKKEGLISIFNPPKFMQLYIMPIKLRSAVVS